MSNYTIWNDQEILWSTDVKELADLYFEHAQEVYPEQDIWASEPAGLAEVA